MTEGRCGAVITVEDIRCSDRGLAARILAHARVIAPCLTSLEDGDADLAVGILNAVAAEAQARGNRFIASQGVGSARVSYGAASSWFTQDDRDALRALCPAAARSAGGQPVGAFPAPARAFERVWPEERE